MNCYSVNFGAMFINFNSSHSMLVADVFVITLTGEYVTMLFAASDYDSSFLYDGGAEYYSDVGADSTSLIQFGDLLYNYSIHSFIITNDLFPLDLDVTLVWNFTSTPPFFSEAGTYNIVKNFSLSSDSGIPGYFIPITISILLGGVLVFILFNKKKKISINKY